MDAPNRQATAPRTLLIACGALAQEVMALIRLNGWEHISVACLPAAWHNTPQRIPGAVRAKIREARPHYDEIKLLYGDCGTGGLLDEVLKEEGVTRIAGPHCYAFYAGLKAFDDLAEAEPGTFYLTDYLVRHFDRLVIEGLGLDRHPELLPDYFGNYTALVYLAQSEDAALQSKAKAAAERLGLSYRYRYTALDGLSAFMKPAEA